MKYLLILLFSINLYAASNCSIESYAQIIKINKLLDDSIIKKSNCSEKILSEFIKLIENSNGKLTSTNINSYFQSSTQNTVKLTPKIIEVYSIQERLQNKYGDNKIVITKVSSLMGNSSLNLNSNTPLRFSCSNCKTGGSKNIQLEYSHKKSWIGADFKIKSIAYKLNRNLSHSNAILQKNDFSLVEHIHKSGTPLFSDIDNIQFYRLNKYLAEGAVLKTSDLYPKKLIERGQKVKLLIKSNQIKLKSIGISKKSGSYGEYIEIQNPKTKKVFTAKVINFNEALVEL